MKFTKKQAYENIVAKLTPNGETLSLSERSINDQLETLIPLLANEETELDDFVKSCFPIFKTANANVNNDVSAGIKKYKTEHPAEEETGKNKPKPNEENKPTDTESALEKRLAELEGRLAEQDKASKIAGIKKQLKDSLKEKGVKSESWIDLILSEVSIAEDCDVSTKADSLLGLYNKTVADVDTNVVPRGGAGGGGNQDTVKDILEAAKQYKKNIMSN